MKSQSYCDVFAGREKRVLTGHLCQLLSVSCPVCVCMPLFFCSFSWRVFCHFAFVCISYRQMRTWSRMIGERYTGECSRRNAPPNMLRFQLCDCSFGGPVSTTCCCPYLYHSVFKHLKLKRTPRHHKRYTHTQKWEHRTHSYTHWHLSKHRLSPLQLTLHLLLLCSYIHQFIAPLHFPLAYLFPSPFTLSPSLGSSRSPSVSLSFTCMCTPHIIVQLYY